MNIQQSYKDTIHNEGSGKLYLVATPIGNLEDMTFRAVRMLKEVDVIAAEDTRQTRKLLNHYDIHTRLISYHEHNKQSSGKHIMERLESGEQVALVSDAGLPAISDPGFELVREAIENGHDVIPIPGANAALTGLIASGMDTSAFTFIGFPARDKKMLKLQLEHWGKWETTLMMYEAPHRVVKTLQMMLEIWGDRRIVLARELTKRHEEFLRGKISECIEHFIGNDPLGEFCMFIEGYERTAEDDQETSWWTSMSIQEHVSRYIQEGMPKKDAVKAAALDRGLPKREVYNECIDL
ncbi:16S rRNA (cytidine(1402)-2'-O)-methyltransferase [Marinicrinis lubricantis]|uniref:Ribosomal RNA small subunit methyltransferase I n=1 Tax=Marinicrinis lubricantis TaxID=2086470 RepID=A0ABW1IQF8_9BACL